MAQDATDGRVDLFFDLLRLEVTVAVRDKLGFDGRMTKLCGQLWIHQVQWQPWDGPLDASA